MYLLGLLIGILSVAPCVIVYLLFIRGADRYEPEPLWLLAAMFCWGAFGATGLSVIGSTLGQGAMSIALGSTLDEATLAASGATFVAPLVEEVAKGLGLILLWLLSWKWLKELDGPLDGVIYGGAIGLGFTLTEDALYLAAAFEEGGLAGFSVVFVLRTVLAGLGHASFTAVFGLAVGFAVERRQVVLRLIVPALGLVGAIALHAIHNALVTFFLGDGVGLLVKLMLFWMIDGLFFLIVIGLVIHDRDIVRKGLADEIGTLLDQHEFELTSSRRMLIPLWNLAVLSPSPTGYRLSRRKQLALIELAFVKHRRRRGEEGLDEIESGLRGEILTACHQGVWLGARV